MARHQLEMSQMQKDICKERITKIWNDDTLTRDMIICIADGLLEMEKRH